MFHCQIVARIEYIYQNKLDLISFADMEKEKSEMKKQIGHNFIEDKTEGKEHCLGFSTQDAFILSALIYSIPNSQLNANHSNPSIDN